MSNGNGTTPEPDRSKKEHVPNDTTSNGNATLSELAGSRKRPIELDDDDDSVHVDPPSKSSRIEASSKHSIVEPIQPDPKYSIPTASETDRFIVYMAVRECDPSFADGLSKCRAACNDEQIQSCLQFNGTRHITMFDGYLTNEQARNLVYQYNRFEDGTFNPIKLKIDGWMPWDAGCYLKINPVGEKMLLSMLRKIAGFPEPVQRSLQSNNVPKNSKVKFPCNHLSLYRVRPNIDRSKTKKAFELIRKAAAKHDWGYVEGVGIRMKVLGGPYTDCKVLAGY